MPETLYVPAIVWFADSDVSTRVDIAPLTYAVDGMSANIVVGKNKHKNKKIPRIKSLIFVKQKTTENISSGWSLRTM